MERAVARDMDDRASRERDLCADRRAVAEAHGAEAARGQELTRMSAAVVLGAPQLMLTDIGRDDGVLRGLFRDRAEQLMRMDNAFVVLCAVVELLPPLGDLLKPCGVLVFLDVRQNLFKEGLCVGNDRASRFNVLVDLRGVDVHMDDAGARCEVAGVGGNAIGEACADAEQQVAALYRPVGGNRAVHADHAEAQRVVVGHAADRHHGVRGRDFRLAHQRQKRLACVRQLYAAAVVDERALGLVEHFSDGFQLFLADVVGFVHLDLALRDKLALCARDVLRDVDEYRTRTSGLCDTESLADGVRQLLYVANHEIVLGDRHGDAGDIDLLEGVASDEARADVAGDGNHRDGVHIGCCDAGDEVGRARSARCEAHADPAGRTCITVRRVSRALLVCRQNVMNAVAVLVKCVVDVENCTARITEDGINALLHERVDEDLRTVLYHAKPPPFSVIHNCCHRK